MASEQSEPPREVPSGRGIAGAIARGVTRHFLAAGYAVLPEFTLANGRRLDLLMLTPKGALAAVEIKSSRADFLNDHKWESYLEYCEAFYFAVPPDFPLELLPESPGLLLADSYEAHILREAPLHPLAPARRKAMTLAFALTAGRRLSQLLDPGVKLFFAEEDLTSSGAPPSPKSNDRA